MELVKIAKTNLRNNLKKKLSQMTASEIAEQSKTITNKVSYINYNIMRNKHSLNIMLSYRLFWNIFNFVTYFFHTSILD